MKKVFLAVLVVVLIAVIAYLSVTLFYYQKEVKRLQQVEATKNTNIKVVGFAKLFVDKVLASKEEVNFDDRLKLENAVRDINDAEILGQWEKFTKASSSGDAQSDVVTLLQLLLAKIQ